MKNFKVSKKGFEKWLFISKELERDSYNLKNHNFEQINTLFRELQFVEENKELSNEDLLIKFNENINEIIYEDYKEFKKELKEQVQKFIRGEYETRINEKGQKYCHYL